MSLKAKRSTTLTKQKPYYVYMLICNDNKIYTGITTNVDRRFLQHVQGTGARFTRASKPVKIIFTEKQKNRSVATKREIEIKKFSRNKKILLASKNNN